MQGQSHKNISKAAKTINTNVLRGLLNKLLIMQGTRSLSGILLLEGNALFNDALNTFLFTVIYRPTYDKGSFK